MHSLYALTHQSNLRPLLYHTSRANAESREGVMIVPILRRLDIGGGKEVDIDECPRSKLRLECIEYLGPVCTITLFHDHCN